MTLHRVGISTVVDELFLVRLHPLESDSGLAGDLIFVDEHLRPHFLLRPHIMARQGSAVQEHDLILRAKCHLAGIGGIWKPDRERRCGDRPEPGVPEPHAAHCGQEEQSGRADGAHPAPLP